MDQSGPSRYISSLDFGIHADTIEQAQEQTDALIEWAADNGLKLLGGSTNLTREKDPIEHVAYASSGVFRNTVATEQSQSFAHATTKDAPGRHRS